ncbi:hypothetical protein Q8A67_005695 [Cirrhinus molitorella]|uniref:Immunoglobulin domain-containing protein n=1 Tax=Cirrhinus molitorella TaxID=172907 RepID=A0AA88Q8Q1_9TELE|nr:hypothetical protein Q8A67_005695 [Cirrhinus molitorella]
MRGLTVLVFLFFADGVFGFETDGMKSISVMEGDPVTLHTCLNQIQNYDMVLWKFEDTTIAKFDKASQTFLTKDGNDGRFRDRLELNFESGSLTIRNIRTNHSGIYKVDMKSQSGSSSKRFNVTVIGVFDPDADKIKQVSVTEGQHVFLNTYTKVQKDNLMLWMFGRASKRCVYNPIHHFPCDSDASVIARMDGETREVSVDAGDNEMFNNKLKVDKLTGSLTIKDARTEHAGFYILRISNNTGINSRRIFNVTVNAVTKSHPHEFWKSAAIVLLLLVVVCGLPLGFIVWRNRNVFLGKLRSYNCCQSTGAQQRETMRETVTEGDSVRLNTGHAQLERDNVVVWKFGGNVIAKISRAANKSCQKIYDGVNGKFRDRLELNGKTGSLTIRNTRTTDSGDYEVQIATNGKVESYQKFSVSVIDSSQNMQDVSDESPLVNKESCSTSNIELCSVCLVLLKLQCQYQ